MTSPAPSPATPQTAPPATPQTAPVALSRAALQATLADRLGSANEARWMMEGVLGRHLASRREVSGADARTLEAMAGRRVAGEPLQYVLGRWAFRTLELSIDRRALIPRPETEQVVEVALGELRRTAVPGAVEVADLGTGSGAIALSIAAELGRDRPGLRVWATDADPAALGLAEENRALVVRTHRWVSEQVRFRAGSWFGALPAIARGRLHLVVANPPYVSEGEWGSLDPEVRCEPYQSLVAGPGSDGTPGMAGVEAIVSGAFERLAPGGSVVVELAPAQARAAAALATRAGYRDVRVEPDLAGRERALVARR